MKPQPPCGRHCPKRCAVPNCHDPAICGDWAAYQDALAVFNRNVLTGRRSERDYDRVRSNHVRVRKNEQKRKEREQS